MAEEKPQSNMPCLALHKQATLESPVALHLRASREALGQERVTLGGFILGSTDFREPMNLMRKKL